MKKSLLFLLLFSFLSPVTSFALLINTVFVRNSNQGGNNLEVIANVRVSSSPAARMSYSSMLRNDTLFVTSCYVHGHAATYVNISDTIQVGALPPGNYTLYFKGYTSTNQIQCNKTDSASKTIGFIVNQPLGIKQNTLTSEPAFYPNPVTDVLHVTGYQVAQLNLYDLRGKLVKRYDFSTQNSSQISVTNLPKGLYVADLISRSGEISRKRLVKH